jgi:hypothetical protein
MIRLTPSQARTLRLLTKNGQLKSFATSLVNDAHSRSLRELVDNGYLTYEYTGTQRVYTLTEAFGPQFPVRREGKIVAKKKIKEATNGQASESHKDQPADSRGEDTGNDKSASIATAEPVRAAKVTSSKIKQKDQDERTPAPAPTLNNDEPRPIRKKSKPHVSHPDLPSPTLADLLAVGKMAAQHGGANKLLALVALVDDLGRKVGGIDRLRGALEGLESLAKLFK